MTVKTTKKAPITAVVLALYEYLFLMAGHREPG